MAILTAPLANCRSLAAPVRGGPAASQPVSASTYHSFSTLSRFPILQHLHHVRYLPQLRGDASGHSGRAAKRTVNAHEVVIHEIQCHRMCVVLSRLAECVGQAGEAAGVHAKRKVRSFGITGADMLGIGAAGDRVLLCTDALGWAVTPGRMRRLAVNLNELG